MPNQEILTHIYRKKKLEALNAIVSTLQGIHDCMTKLTTPIDIAALQLVSEFQSEQ